MATTCAMIERRRASRVRLGTPLTVFHEVADGETVETRGVAVEVSRCGARVRVPFSSPIGSRIRIVHDRSQESREFRVIRVSERRRDGTFELGVEILYPARNFWDVRFPDESLEYVEAGFEHESPGV